MLALAEGKAARWNRRLHLTPDCHRRRSTSSEKLWNVSERGKNCDSQGSQHPNKERHLQNSEEKMQRHIGPQSRLGMKDANPQAAAGNAGRAATVR